MTIGIIGGAGTVGSAWKKILSKNNIVRVADPVDPHTVTIEELLPCEFTLITVPTPTIGHQRLEALHLSLLDLQHLSYNGIVVIKSTVLPHSIEGLADQYHRLKIIHHPDFLLERDAYNSLERSHFHLVGSYNDEYATDWGDVLFSLFKCPTMYVSLKMAAFVKYAINILLASKVTICNELYLAASEEKIEWNTIRDLITLDSRIGVSHMQVPGPDGKYGFGGTCFPKDMEAFAWEYQSLFLHSILNMNEKHRNG